MSQAQGGSGCYQLLASNWSVFMFIPILWPTCVITYGLTPATYCTWKVKGCRWSIHNDLLGKSRIIKEGFVIEIPRKMPSLQSQGIFHKQNSNGVSVTKNLTSIWLIACMFHCCGQHVLCSCWSITFALVPAKYCTWKVKGCPWSIHNALLGRPYRKRRALVIEIPRKGRHCISKVNFMSSKLTGHNTLRW